MNSSNQTCLVLTEKVGSINKIIDSLYNVFDSIYLIKKYSDLMQISEDEQIKKIIVDLNHSVLENAELSQIFQNENLKIVFIALNDDNKILFNNLFDANHRFSLLEFDENYQDIESYENNLQEALQIFDIERSSGFNSKKKSRIFLEKDSFEKAITQEVRRAKRYHYPVALVLFRVENEQYLEMFVNFFAEKIREFDFLWIYENGFAMVLPHTGWDGAEILTSRLTTKVLDYFSLRPEELQHNILSLKQVENDREFLDRIYTALESKFYNISSGIGFESWKEELFSEFIETKTVRLMNSYHGMLISHDADISVEDDLIVLSNIRPLQIASMHIERATYFMSKTLNRMVRGGIHRINQEEKSISLSNFEIIEENIFQRNSLRIELNEQIGVSLKFHDETTVIGEMKELSLNSALISLPKQFYLQKGNEILLDFSLKVKAKNYRVIIQTKVTSIEYTNGKFLLELNLKAELNENKIISDYLSKKQLNLINELRNYNFH